MVALAAVAVVVVALVALVGSLTSPGQPAHRRTALSAHQQKKRNGGSHKGHGQGPTTQPPAPTFLGPDGVESRAIIAENEKPGTTAWQINDASAPGNIEGFADQNYAAAGTTVGLYVSTTAPTFTVVAYRMGWYGGAGARQVWASGTVQGVVQPPCPLTSGINMVSCDNWTQSLSVTVTSSWPSGDYLLKLVGSQGQQAYVMLTVWDPTSTATYLIMARSLTEEGWNTFGGYDFYQGEGPCPPGAPSYPVCNRARVVSFDRPYADGDGASDFLSNEYPLVRFAEEHGLDVTYVTDITIDEHPQIVMQHKALLSLGHDETWTYAEREAMVTAEQHGVNVAFFGAAAVLRHSRLQPSPLGPDREEVDYRDSAEDPLDTAGDPMDVTGNQWASPPTSWPEFGFIGDVYSGYLEPNTGTVPMVVWDQSAWIFKGTGLSDGESVPGVVESDFDHIMPSEDIPSDLQVLAHSPIPLSIAYTNQGQWGSNTYSDMTYYTDPVSKAGIWDSGTVNWINALTPCAGAGSAPAAPAEPAATQASCPSAAVSQMTGNLLWLFGQGPAGTVVPSVANWQQVTPAGS